MKKDLSSIVNDSIRAVCLNGESLETYKPQLNSVEGLYERCTLFVRTFQETRHNGSNTEVSLRKITFLGKQVGLNEETLQLLTDCLKGKQIESVSPSPAKEKKPDKTLPAAKPVSKPASRPESKPKTKTDSGNKGWLWVFGIGAIIAAIVAYIRRPVEEIVQRVPPTREERLEEAIQKISTSLEMETVEYVVKEVFTCRDESMFSPILGFWGYNADKTMVFTFTATLVGGIRLDGFSRNNIHVSDDGESVQVFLPKAKLLETRINGDIQLHEYTGLFRSYSSAQQIQDARIKAERMLKDNVRDYPILEDAQDNAAAFITSLMKQLEFKKVTVSFK